ncbi:anaerobic sulfatase maturase [bacterium]|nr:anaerobic sulfatase maturase [bacterium]
MHCSYCFYLEKSTLFPETIRHRMKLDVLVKLTRQVMEQGGPEIAFGWQGGEPSLMGIPFFERAVESQIRFAAPGQHAVNGFQTNGLLMTRDWAGFLRESKFLVGLSMDGPAHIHDHCRLLRNGRPSWLRVARARDLLLENGVDVNALVVVNAYSARFPREIYAYHKENGLPYMQFIPCLEPDPDAPGRPAAYSVSAEAFGDFLIALFECWKADFRQGKPGTYIRWFESLFFTYVDMPAPECTLLQECGNYLVIEHNGDIFSCDFFVESGWRLGNVINNRLTDCLNSPQQVRFGRLKARLPGPCIDCPWIVHCRGGCPKDRKYHASLDGLNYFCESYRRFFEHADPFFRSLAEGWKTEQKRRHVRDMVQTAGIQIGRNDPCPCGSELKYKKCCGREASGSGSRTVRR